MLSLNPSSFFFFFFSKLFFPCSLAQVTLREIVDTMQKIYCGTIGFEYMHIQNRQLCDWLRGYIETPVRNN